jgi:hypothetical protein
MLLSLADSRESKRHRPALVPFNNNTIFDKGIYHISWILAPPSPGAGRISWKEAGMDIAFRARRGCVPRFSPSTSASLGRSEQGRCAQPHLHKKIQALLEVWNEKGSGMIWIEMISTRAAGIVEAEKILEICRQTHQFIAGEELLKMSVFCNTRHATDISIHLQWKSDPGTGSVLGRELTSALADLGLINHTLWIEQNEF